MKKEDILNNFPLFNRCVQILKIGNDETTKREICQFTRDTPENISLINLIKWLKENEFIDVENPGIGKPYSITINRKKLANFLRDSKFFNDIGIIIQTTKPYDYNY